MKQETGMGGWEFSSREKMEKTLSIKRQKTVRKWNP